MRFEQLFVIRDEILGVIDSEDLRDLAREIARIISPIDDGVTAVSMRRECRARRLHRGSENPVPPRRTARH